MNYTRSFCQFCEKYTSILLHYCVTLLILKKAKFLQIVNSNLQFCTYAQVLNESQLNFKKVLELKLNIKVPIQKLEHAQGI